MKKFVAAPAQRIDDPAMRARPAIFGLACFTAGCCGMCAETTRSENVRTEGMSLHARVDARDGGKKTEISATLRAGGVLSNLFPQVVAPDRIEARVGADAHPLAFAHNMIATPGYVATIPGDAGGQTIEIHFLRSGNTTAAGTRVVMPPGLTITAPRAGETFSPVRPALTITWTSTSPSPLPTSFSVSGACILPRQGDLAPDPGRLDLVLAAAPPPDGGPYPSRCDVTIRLERQQRGTVDPAFGEGGSILASQSRERVIEFTP